MIKVLICFFCIGAYIGIALAVYAFYHTPDDDDEENTISKVMAGIWPISLPLALVYLVVVGIGDIMDLIGEYQDRRADK